MQKYFLMIGLAIVIFSCKKKPKTENPTDPTDNCPVTEINYPGFNLSTNLVYNGDKVVSEENADSKITYKYENDKITKTEISKIYTANIVTKAYILSGSKIISFKETNSSPLLKGRSSEYLYNSENQLITVKSVDEPFHTLVTLEYTNGNVTKITNVVTTDANNGTPSVEQPFIYTTEKYLDTDGYLHPFYLSVYPLASASDRYLLEYGYFGANPTNMVKSYRDDSYSITKNSAGKISAVAQRGTNIINFTRSCN